VARDKGCAFPGCTDPPEWTEKHHVVPWSEGGRTDLDNLCLLCDFHHDRIDTGGWQIVMRDGVPWFVPPAWLDPRQEPQRNVRP
ncbi:MAG TPA: HNH endonuclease signature motif containing protein, partial [Jatrophihabitans sp.]|nr:HNH endonuclease signature motif containing protein [Jatrophihabitans sp.]